MLCVLYTSLILRDIVLHDLGGYVSKRLLIVDDEIDLVDALAAHLEADGYEVLKALDGKDGYEKVQTQKPDAVLLDLRMPRMDGFQVCRLIKFDDSLKAIKVIILTAHNSDNEHKIGKSVGADAFLTKPYEYPNLLETIKGLLGE
ncbi:MAG: two-component system response regulator [Deltaproteobacteria bacterium CG11_big_fil_rev_8_21_14_0_20_47_16]|nr:MAG: two-component system response regulator [Deltaproteobacteria bacterium CG11_big_fil_rev_8_21_14_0_20_47_16]